MQSFGVGAAAVGLIAYLCLRRGNKRSVTPSRKRRGTVKDLSRNGGKRANGYAKVRASSAPRERV